MSHYTGPWCKVTMSDGATHNIQGTADAIQRDLEAGEYARLKTVYGQDAMLAGKHVSSLKQMPPGKGEGFRQR